jgi:hypothetical protein
MELHWRANPVGKVRLNLPFFKKFTQESCVPHPVFWTQVFLKPP